MMLAQAAKEEWLEVVGIDSVASFLTTEEAEKDPREIDRVASQARMMSKALRRVNTVNKKTLFLWTNQERMDIGVKFGNPKTTWVVGHFVTTLRDAWNFAEVASYYARRKSRVLGNSLRRTSG